jgi:hypothetical protein
MYYDWLIIITFHEILLGFFLNGPAADATDAPQL